MTLAERISKSIYDHREHPAFCIAETFYTYEQLALSVSGIRERIQQQIPEGALHIGLVANDDLETYASIIALWLEGKAYVPIHPKSPIERNRTILELTETPFVLDSSETSAYQDPYTVLPTAGCTGSQLILGATSFDQERIAYILFTSGTTGVPKGVPITFTNINAMMNALDTRGFILKPEDKSLQMFDLTFDFSLATYLPALLYGACSYTIPHKELKYFYIFKLLHRHQLTILTMVPSIIRYLRPYFAEINATNVRWSSFGGGALHEDVALEWYDCIPNAQIYNFYGPTEFSCYTSYYEVNRNGANSSRNGIISMGKPLPGVRVAIADTEKNTLLPNNAEGELCLAGVQLTPGYWKNEERNAKSFFTVEVDGTEARFYRTGDLATFDPDGNLLFLGRADFQAKIQGYRVELDEIEFHAKSQLGKRNAVALIYQNKLGHDEIGLVIEGDPIGLSDVEAYMKAQMPPYMIPSQTHFVKTFPMSMNQKIDRKQLKLLFIPGE